MEQTQPDVDRLDDRVVLVTAAAEGIGRAVARACAAAGATVVLSEPTEADVADIYDAIVADGGPEPAILPLSLEQASEADFLAAADLLGESFGRLDGLVHCPCFAPFLSRIDDYEANEWERVIRINLTAPFLLTQACMPLLRAAQDASVIITSASRLASAGPTTEGYVALPCIWSLWIDLLVRPTILLNRYPEQLASLPGVYIMEELIVWERGLVKSYRAMLSGITTNGIGAIR